MTVIACNGCSLELGHLENSAALPYIISMEATMTTQEGVGMSPIKRIRCPECNRLLVESRYKPEDLLRGLIASKKQPALSVTCPCGQHVHNIDTNGLVFTRYWNDFAYCVYRVPKAQEQR